MDPLLGQIQLFAFQFAPRGWHVCDGTLLPIRTYQALYSLLGNTYGGDGSSTFALPNLQGAEPVPQMKYYIALEGLYPVRD